MTLCHMDSIRLLANILHFAPPKYDNNTAYIQYNDAYLIKTFHGFVQ